MTNPSSKALQVFAENLERLMGDPETPYKTDKQIEERTRQLGNKVSYRTVQRYRKKKSEPSFDHAEMIAKVFGLEVWHMLLKDLQPGERPEIRRRVAVEI